MIVVLHGDNTTASRGRLVQMLDQAKQKGTEDIVRLSGKKMNQTDLIQALEAGSLFGTDRLVIIEKMFVGPRSKAKTEMITYLKTAHEHPQTPHTIIWEDKLVTAAQLKSLGNPQHFSYKISKVMFTFLDSLKPNNQTQMSQLLSQALNQEGAELIFAMLVRQIRLLLQIKVGSKIRMAPWQQKKLQVQAGLFSQANLVTLHKQLLDIDYSIKSGASLLKMKDQLDLFVAKI